MTCNHCGAQDFEKAGPVKMGMEGLVTLFTCRDCGASIRIAQRGPDPTTFWHPEGTDDSSNLVPCECGRAPYGPGSEKWKARHG